MKLKNVRARGDRRNGSFFQCYHFSKSREFLNYEFDTGLGCIGKPAPKQNKAENNQETVTGKMAQWLRAMAVLGFVPSVHFGPLTTAYNSCFRTSDVPCWLSLGTVLT